MWQRAQPENRPADTTNPNVDYAHDPTPCACAPAGRRPRLRPHTTAPSRRATPAPGVRTHLPTRLPVCPFLSVSVNLFRFGACTTDLDSMSARTHDRDTPTHATCERHDTPRTTSAPAWRLTGRTARAPPDNAHRTLSNIRTQVLSETRHGCRLHRARAGVAVM